MQVSATALIGQELTLASAKDSGRSQRTFSAETFGSTRNVDSFERSLSSATQQVAPKSTYDTDVMKKMELAKIAASQTPQTPSNTAIADEAPQTASQVQFTQADVQNLMKLFGSTQGDGNFMSQYDLDGNGTINLQDLNAMLANIAAVEQGTVSFTQQDLDLLLEAFGAQIGDELFNPALDLDGDGIIGLADLNLMLANFTQPETPEGFTQAHIDQLMSVMGAGKGDENFIAQLDLNGDGTLDLSDLNLLLAAISGQNT
jgi:Ca2+-binding EF-hand superfamily protein